MAPTAANTTEPKETRESDKGGSSPIVIVELDEPQSAIAVRRLRKGKGKLLKHVEQIVKDLVDDGTVKANAQPIVLVVQEIPVPPWAFGYDEDEDEE
jgi:hypothetical protein